MKNAKIIENCIQACANWGLLPTAFRQCMTWEEQVLWLARFLQETVIPTVNENTEAFNDLKAYVENFFDNLDVQEEINNKLDEMAEDGTLQEIITAYIQASVAWVFNTVADMKLAENLVNGSYARTLGFYAVGDGGGATYKIGNTGTANEMDIIAVGSLFANLVVESRINAKQLGAYGNGTNDDTAILQRCLTIANGKPLYLPQGTYLSDGLSTNSIEIISDNATIKAKSNYNTYLLTVTGKLIAENLTLDGDSKIDTLIHINGGDCNLTNITFKNSEDYCFTNTPNEDEDFISHFDNCSVIDCAGGVFVAGHPYQDPDDFRGNVEFINCKTSGNSGTEDKRLYFFTQLNYVNVNGGDFTGSSDGGTNVYKVNHANIIGGYYHDMTRGATLGKITKNATVTNTINENLTGGGGLHIDLVTEDRVHPMAHSVISNNVVKNAYRAMYIQGKNMLITNNYVYCGSNTVATGGVIRFNDNDDNTANSNVIVDGLYVYNLGDIANVINCGTSVITLGNIYLDGTNIVQASVASNNPIIRQHMKTAAASGSTHITINDEVVLINVTAAANIMLPNAAECKTIGKEYILVRTDDTANSVSLRCRSDNGTINGAASAGGTVLITKGVTRVVQTGAGEYWTM